jgi:hypothetical protein
VARVGEARLGATAQQVVGEGDVVGDARELRLVRQSRSL